MPKVIIHFKHWQIAECFEFCPHLVRRLQVLHGHWQPQLPVDIIGNTIGISMLSSSLTLSGWDENTNLPSFVVTRMEANGLAKHAKLCEINVVFYAIHPKIRSISTHTAIKTSKHPPSLCHFCRELPCSYLPTSCPPPWVQHEHQHTNDIFSRKWLWQTGRRLHDDIPILRKFANLRSRFTRNKPPSPTDMRRWKLNQNR